MKRRDSIKTLLAGSIATTTLLTSCQPPKSSTAQKAEVWKHRYGRTSDEKQRDEEILNKEPFLNSHETETLRVLADIILPASTDAPSAVEVGVLDFIDFILRDMPSHQTPIRGGMMWLDSFATKLHNSTFVECNTADQVSICEAIAYPTTEDPQMEAGIKFFAHLRNLVLTGYYTSEKGLQDLGYQGNSPNVWDGIPPEVLAEHDVEYEDEWLAKCIDQDTRNEIARWDEEGNLLT